MRSRRRPTAHDGAGGSVCSTDRFRPFAREDVEQSITSVFARQVALHPERIAVKTRHDALTYDALDAAANRVAQAIAVHTRSAPPESSVALLFGQTSGAVAATLGALKAGRTYVPLEPSHPPDRLIEILNDSMTALLVTDSRHLPLLNELADRWPVLNVDDLEGAGPAGDPQAALSATTLAAIFYTSGTTGTPKGVMQDHRSILHRVMVDTNTLQIRPADRLSLLSPPTYSVSLRNLFGALLNGATVYPFDLEEEGLGRIAGWLSEERITVFSATPTVFRHFAGTLTGHEQFSDVRLVDIGGEGAHKSDVELYKRHFPPACLLSNTLGCNEAGVFRRYIVDRDTPIDGIVVPVGHEVPDKEVVLLRDGVEVGTNQLGEIAIRSSYLPRGYWGRPDLTAAAFVPDPRGGDRHLYLTGDMGEMRPDGCLLYRGRTDTKVKIRGQFIDLSELEVSLLRHEGVTEAVVKALPQPGNRTQLVAFVVPAPGSVLSTRSLRRFLTRQLPAFMVPAKFVVLRSLPRFPNGKVDRQALALPDVSRVRRVEINRADGPEYVAPVETIEHQLVEIWEECLGVHPISVRDNFFDLGGDSLMALQMMAEVELRCGEALPASALIGAPTLGELAKTLVEQRIHRHDSLLVRVQAGNPEWPFFFLHGDFRGGGFYCLNLARALGRDQRFYALGAHGLNGGPVPPTIEAMAASYIDMIQRVEPEGPYLLGGLCHAGLIAFEMARQLERKGHSVGLVAMIGPPAWNPPHWRWLKDGIAAVVGLCGGGPEQTTDLFLALRDRRIRWRQFCGYSTSWLQGMVGSPLSDRFAGTVRLVKRMTSGVLVSEKPWAAEPLVAPAGGDRLMTAYHRAVASYVRRPYSGQVAVLWPLQVPVNTLGGAPLEWSAASDSSLGWKKIVANLEVQELAGDYTTSITTHVQVLANRLKSSIKKARTHQRAEANGRVRRIPAEAGL